jgi:hypothetical protein
MAKPTPSSRTLMVNRVRVRDDSAGAARAKIMPKKNKTATAMAPNNVMICTVMCGVASYNLILPLEGKVYFDF